MNCTVLSGTLPTQSSLQEVDTPRGILVYNATRARTPVELCTDANTRRLRIGPVLQPAGGWFHVLQTDVTTWGFVAPGDAVARFDATPRDTSNRPIWLPPLHVHHAHVTRRTPTQPFDIHFMNTHGDYLLREGLASYARSTPRGSGLRVEAHDRIGFNAVINDVRSHGPPLLFYLDVTVKLAPSNASAVSFVWFTHADVPRFDAYDRIAVPNTPSVAWWSGTMPRAGVLTSSVWIHSHRMRYYAQLLTSRSVCTDGWIGIVGAALLDTRALRVPPAAAWRHIVATQGDGVVCKAESEKEPSAVRVAGRFYDRSEPIACRPWRFARDDAWGMVALYTPRWDVEQQVLYMHSEFHAYVEANESYDYMVRGAAMNSAPAHLRTRPVESTGGVAAAMVAILSALVRARDLKLLL